VSSEKKLMSLQQDKIFKHDLYFDQSFNWINDVCKIKGILCSCYRNPHRGNISKFMTDREFDLKIWDGGWHPQMILDKMSPWLLSDF
jgi:hypothetical protein